MRVRLPVRCLAAVFAATSIGVADGDDRPRCPMQPARVRLQMPASGFTSLDEEAEIDCPGTLPASKWNRRPAGTVTLFVSANGPSGSGRYWNLVVGIAKPQQRKPIRGICLTASTLGWRTLQAYAGLPLKWIDDLDGDGKAELIVWDSFSIGAGDLLGEYGLTAWVYRPVSEGTLSIDWLLSRRMARDVATTYRMPPRSPDPGGIRAKAAAALELFANERCVCGTDRTP